MIIFPSRIIPAARPIQAVRALTVIAVTAFVSVATIAAATAEPTFAFATTPGKLPKTVVPLHYAIELTPNLDTLVLTGSEVVDIEVSEPTASVVLNAVDMTFAGALIDDGAQRAAVALDAAAGTATLTFAQPLATGAHKLHVAFTGKINSFARGLFYVDYPTGNGTKRMLSTQLEAADARRVFPCWDEPAFKATFALTVTVPRAFMAVNNMPSVHEEPVGTDLKKVSFAPTPKMSSYLFVLTTGDLERITAQAGDVTVGVVTTAGKSQQGRFALDSAVQVLGYYNEFFGVRYPLPKLDLIAVPGGFSGAMENWGGITYFETTLLFDPATSADTDKRRIFTILAHEMAHQWFGDLVTMGWWDNLWLNEGFASWMQIKAAEHFHPQWQGWLNNNGSKQYAMTLDARRTSHPIQQPVTDETEAMAAFDSITYIKGQNFIHMLESYIGDDALRDGIRHYMAAHAYGNTTTADLWQALETAAGKPVRGIAASFTEQDGIPLVIAETACHDGRQRLTLRQERFVTVPSTGAGVKPLPPHSWHVPIAIGLLGATPTTQSILLNGNAEVAAGSCDQPVKVNLGGIGYYRVDYGPRDRAALTATLTSLAPEDRVDLISDSWALVRAGRDEPSSFLRLIERLGPDDARVVWDQVISALTTFDDLARNRPERPALQTYLRARLRPVFERLGWDNAAHSSDDDALLRARLIETLGNLGDVAIVAEAKRRFAAFLKDPQSLPTALRDPVTHLVGIGADQATHDTLLALARKSTAMNERIRYYTAAASAHNPDLARATLALTLTDELPSTLVGRVIIAVASNGEQPELAWEFVQTNFKTLFDRLGPGFRDETIPDMMLSFTDEAHAAELGRFAPIQASPGGRVEAARAQETIVLAADFKARALPAVTAWIRDHHGPQP